MLDVADPVGKHLLGLPVPRVELGERPAQTFVTICDRDPLAGVRHRMPPVVVARAGVEQRLLVGEVPVDGRAIDPGPLGDRLHAGARGADGLVERDSRLGDPPAGLPLRHRSLALAMDEYSYVLEGRMGAARRRRRARRGRRSGLQAARPMAHVLERGRWPLPDPRDHLPGRVRALFDQMATAMASPAFDPQRMAEIADRYGIEIRPDSVPQLCAAHGLTHPTPSRPLARPPRAGRCSAPPPWDDLRAS